ncbi:MAG: tRNA lysidine(34) synthetase TilS [Thermodesulfovibrionales bacterium]|nr:tRNA lysidine(34) synthetase TilS [Thermodesulfovibrionales bacterium]
MDIKEVVLKTISEFNMINNGDHILVGLSGGADSVALLVLLNQLKAQLNIKLSSIYIDHKLRPLETPDEIEFCKYLCDVLKADFYVRDVDVKEHAQKTGMSIQESARELRYEAFYKLSYEINANKIALGHNADDQLETIFMRLIRGTGVSGLLGIPPVRDMIIRPLLDVRRRMIEDFLIKNREIFGLKKDKPYIIDSSNLKTDYIRNRLRFQVMPRIEEINPSIHQTISRMIQIIRDEERYFDILVTKTLMKLITRKAEGYIELFLSPLETIEKPILRRVLRRAIDATKGLRGIGFENIEDIINLIRNGKTGGRVYIRHDIRVIRGYSTLIITSLKPQKLSTVQISTSGEYILKEAGIVLIVDELSADELQDGHDGKSSAVFDVEKLSMPLIIRHRNPGDFFYPSGFGKRKKVQDFFVDEKIPKDERDTVPILTSNGNIVWIVGYRTDERYKIDKDAKRVLRFIIKAHKK